MKTTTTTTQCRNCGRPLSDPFSVEVGFGPICRGEVVKKLNAPDVFMSNNDRSDFSLNWFNCERVLLISEIWDSTNPKPSLTNSVERVIQQIVEVFKINIDDWIIVQDVEDIRNQKREFDVVFPKGQHGKSSTDWKYLFHEEIEKSTLDIKLIPELLKSKGFEIKKPDPIENELQ